MKIITEGGNEFKFADGTAATKQNASTEQASSALDVLGAALGIDLQSRKAGSIIYPGAETGDADTVLDPTEFIKIAPDTPPKDAQNQFRVWLAGKLKQAGYVELPKKASIEAAGKYYKIAGDGLTAMVQLPSSEESLQVDLDIAEPGEGKFSLWSKRGEPNAAGTPKDARAKGAYRHILKTEISRVLISPEHPQGLSWSFKNGLLDRATNAIVTKDPAEIAKILFGGVAADLDNIQSILAKFKQTHPDKYNDVVAKFNAGLERYKTQYKIQESHVAGSREWFRYLMDNMK